MLPVFRDQIAVEQLDKDVFVTQLPPLQLGNILPIAYGGCTIAAAINAACQTVDPRYHVYSLLGSFLGPTRTDRKVVCRVTRTRDTKTFASRLVFAVQKQDDGSERACAQIFLDFHVKEPSLLSYHPPRPEKYGSDPLDRDYALPASDIIENASQDRRITPEQARNWRERFRAIHTYFQSHMCLASVSAQNAISIDREATTTQDHLPVYERTNAQWWRLQEPLSTPAGNLAALGFLMDGGLSFLPLYLSKLNLEDSAACSTLDFSLRLMLPQIDLGSWHLREERTTAASGGRTYSGAKLWNSAGNMAAIMTQFCICRPLAATAAPAPKL